MKKNTHKVKEETSSPFLGQNSSPFSFRSDVRQQFSFGESSSGSSSSSMML